MQRLLLKQHWSVIIDFPEVIMTDKIITLWHWCINKTACICFVLWGISMNGGNQYDVSYICIQTVTNSLLLMRRIVMITLCSRTLWWIGCFSYLRKNMIITVKITLYIQCYALWHYWCLCCIKISGGEKALSFLWIQ